MGKLIKVLTKERASRSEQIYTLRHGWSPKKIICFVVQLSVQLSPKVHRHWMIERTI